MSLFTFDHIHLLSSNAQEAADWYCEMLGGTIEKNEVMQESQTSIKVIDSDKQDKMKD